MKTNPEQILREELKVPADADQVIILSMDAHMDWDWVLNFQTLALNGNQSWSQKSATGIISDAFNLMAGILPPEATPYSNTYYYSICEIGFLRAAIENRPELLNLFKEKIGDKLRIVGGGITSPDNVLPHGELFIRNFLMGKLWMKQTLALPMRQAYIPDDFGHYSQLPIALDAMGFEGVSFSRCPGSNGQESHIYPCSSDPGGCNTFKDLTKPGHVDFVWRAADGSNVITHFMQDHYNQGNHIGAVNTGNGYQRIKGQGNSNNDIAAYIGCNAPAAPTPYIYVPCGDDFASPIAELVGYANEWNATQNFGTQGESVKVYAVAATLDHYIQLVAAYENNHPHTLLERSLHPSPYWTGFYASRPELKILSQAATRALLSAETFSYVADYLQTTSYLTWNTIADARNIMIRSGWETAVQSTHHDFVTGTAEDGVYTGEQIPLLKNAISLGQGASKSAQLEISSLVLGLAKPGETPIVIFNQLGACQSGLVELPSMAGIYPASVILNDGTVGAVQIGENGKILFLANIPSLGYQSASLSTNPVPQVSPLSCKTNADRTVFTLENEHLKATISSSANWGIISLIDKNTNAEMIAGSQIGNDLVFLIEESTNGNLYTFANEDKEGTMNPDGNGKLEPRSALLIEDGPLRITLRTIVEFSSDGSGTPMSALYTRDYSMIINEPILRMSVTGTVPLTANGLPNADDNTGDNYSVMIRFPFAGERTGIQAVLNGMPHGCPFHYETEMPKQYWNAPIFQPTHHFVLPQVDGKNLASIFHADIHAWAIDSDGSLLGCVLRNTPARYGQAPWGANGSDTGMHTHTYAIRIPSGIANPDDIALLNESLCFQMPLQAAYGNIPNGPMGDYKSGTFLGLPASFSLASVSGNAVILAAKHGSVDIDGLVLRIYQPTNKPSTNKITLGSGGTKAFSTIRRITALEDPIDDEQPQTISADGEVLISLNKALTTFLVK